LVFVQNIYDSNISYLLHLRKAMAKQAALVATNISSLYNYISYILFNQP